MKYIENNFYPAWLPSKYRGIIDLSELAEPTEQIVREANALMKILGINVAIYKGPNYTPKGKPNGLCSVFKSAVLQDDQLERLYKAERRLGNYVIVAYANPLQYQIKINL
ncbi:hypothetical protein QQ020_24190 [Fulvivirgaceae bacterium BMA12]|uniref:Uncharacterized protein n=1 Tax=Agaribacillus aureus TaxID=3051825 RepID=A0ABT8LBP3_9BACT|nr:hypothetical protein [Fulvivirgaceae bacterium BMA12]